MVRGKTRERKQWIDLLRAIAMILVVYGHRVSEWTGYFVFTSPVKIPLFFAITGYVFNSADGNFKTFSYKLCRALVIPWLVIAGLPYLAATPVKGLSFLGTKAIALLTGENYWYMPCCILAEIIWFFILKYSKSIWSTGLIAIVLFLIGKILFEFDIMSVFMVNRALSVQVFLCMGKLFYRYENTVVNLLEDMVPLIGGLVIYIFLGILFTFMYPGQNMDVHMYEYHNVLICFLMIIIGSIFLAVFLKTYVKRYPRWLVLIGQNTLVIYLLHGYFVKAVAKSFSILHIPLNRVTNVVLTLMVCCMGLLISLAIHRFLPELVGKRRIKNK